MIGLVFYLFLGRERENRAQSLSLSPWLAVSPSCEDTARRQEEIPHQELSLPTP